MLGRSNPGKVLALRAKQDAGELDLEWFAFRPGYSVDGMLAGKWRDEWPELADDIRELLGES